MSYTIDSSEPSRSFPEGDAFLEKASPKRDARIVIVSPSGYQPDRNRAAVLVELQDECLGDHVISGDETRNVLGFARYRNGSDAPSRLVELVRHPLTDDAAVDAAKALFEGAGLEVVVCTDQPGRVVNRLVVPKYNAALRFLDEGLASQSDLDLTCRLGLGYPDGPIERLERGGLSNHFRVSKAMFEAFGTSAFAPAPRARSASKRGVD